jgi:glucosyl-dolichyl phosphate glucuronosyltransferase
MNVAGAETGNEQAESKLATCPMIAAVICTHNRYDVLSDAIESLCLQSLPREKIEILIVDNSSDIQAQRDYWNGHEPPPNGRLLVETTPGLSRA